LSRKNKPKATQCRSRSADGHGEKPGSCNRAYVPFAGSTRGGVRHCQSTLSTSGSSDPPCGSLGHIQTAHLKHAQTILLTSLRSSHASLHDVPLLPTCDAGEHKGIVEQRRVVFPAWWRAQKVGTAAVVVALRLPASWTSLPLQKGGSWGQVQFQISSREVVCGGWGQCRPQRADRRGRR